MKIKIKTREEIEKLIEDSWGNVHTLSDGSYWVEIMFENCGKWLSITRLETMTYCSIVFRASSNGRDNSNFGGFYYSPIVVSDITDDLKLEYIKYKLDGKQSSYSLRSQNQGYVCPSDSAGFGTK